ncbi:MAG: SGNH/GDSL hydrolase family protein [Mycobacteriales bacterium]
MTRLVALGDSFTCGQGVGVLIPPEQTWVARLASRFPRGTMICLASPGARLADVRARQLPMAPLADLVSVMAGLNDIARTGFDAERVRADLRSTVERLITRPVPVLLARLHDPSRPLSLPWPLCRLIRARVEQLNAAVDEVASHRSVIVLDLAAVPALRTAAGWAVDRVHPSVAGQAAIAEHAARQLRDRGWLLRDDPLAPPARAATRVARAYWCLRHGLPYAVTHGADFVEPVFTAWRAPRSAEATPA